MVGFCGQLVVLVSLAQDQFVVAKAEGVPVHGHGMQVDIRVAAFGLPGGAAIKVPNGQFCELRKVKKMIE